MIGIYKVTNKINGKCYIGQSVDIYRRFQEHDYSFRVYNGKPHNRLYEAMYKYGTDNFYSKIIEICTEQELNDREKYWISYYNSYNDGYNMTVGGDCYQKGEEHPNSKITDKEVLEIKFLLKNSEKTFEEIAELFSDCTRNMVAFINLGSRWSHIGDYEYPLREYFINWLECEVCRSKITHGRRMCQKCAAIERAKVNKGEDHANSKFTVDIVKKVKELLVNTNYTYVRIAELCGMNARNVSSINLGITWKYVGNYEKYPLRADRNSGTFCKDCDIQISSGRDRCKPCSSVVGGKKLRGKNNPTAKLTEDSVREIKDILKNKDITQTEIARVFEVGLSAIQAINRGKTWKWLDEGKYTYPIR